MTEPFILPDHARGLIHQLSSTGKVMILAGQGVWSEGMKKQLQQLAALPQFSIHTEATSNLDDPAFITCIDRVIEGVNETNVSALKPELLVTFGGAVVSKRVKTLLRQWRPTQHWNIDLGQRYYDTYQSLTHDIAVSPEVFFAQVTRSISSCESDYGAAWKKVDARMRHIHDALLSEAPFCDLTVFKTVLDRLPAEGSVHLANSTPARYAQLFDRSSAHRWSSNRGTSGIDGCVSTAVGATFATRRTTTLIVGDIAFCYDSNAFWNGHLDPHLRVIVIDNGGGNIFRYIEGPDRDPELLSFFDTPHGRDPLVLARSYGLPCYEAFDDVSLEQGLHQLYEEHDRPAVLVVRTDAELSPRVLRDYFKQLREA